MKNKIKETLLKINIIDDNSIEELYPRCRDREDVSVLICKKSGVIFLSSTNHIEMAYYEDKNNFEYWGEEDRRKAVNISLEDNERRFNDFKSIITNKIYADIGTGAGGVLDMFKNYASEVYAVEPQIEARENLIKLGFNVYSDINKLQDNYFEVISLFHVFEHLTEPLEFLKEVFKKLKSGGRIIIEVPHARDFLITTLNNEAFKKFTFWSEHLVLHTRQSLSEFANVAGFTNIVVQGVQRYPIANHLHWLSKAGPGGHIKWSFLRNVNLDKEYQSMLMSIDATDTIILQAIKP